MPQGSAPDRSDGAADGPTGDDPCSIPLGSPPPRPASHPARVGLHLAATGLDQADGVAPIDHDQAILASIRRVLRPGGRLVLTGLNAGRMLTAWQQADLAGEVDLMTLTETTDHPLEQGGIVTLREHFHLPEGLALLATSVGLEVEVIWAGGAGDWRRDAPTTEDDELLLVARRPDA